MNEQHRHINITDPMFLKCSASIPLQQRRNDAVPILHYIEHTASLHVAHDKPNLAFVDEGGVVRNNIGVVAPAKRRLVVTEDEAN